MSFVKTGQVKVHQVHSAAVSCVVERYVERLEKCSAIEVEQVRECVHEEVCDALLGGEVIRELEQPNLDEGARLYRAVVPADAQTANKGR